MTVGAHPTHELIGQRLHAGVAIQADRLRRQDVAADGPTVHPGPLSDRAQPCPAQPAPQHLADLDHADLPERHPDSPRRQHEAKIESAQTRTQR